MTGHVRGAARSDAATGAMRKVDIEIYGDLIAADEHAAYWVGSIASRVARVSAKTALLTHSLPLATDASLAAGHVPPNPTDVALGGGALWIAAVDGSLIRVDPNLQGVVASIPSAGTRSPSPTARSGVGRLRRRDRRARRPEDRPAGPPIHVGALPRGIAAADGAVWVTLN